MMVSQLTPSFIFILITVSYNKVLAQDVTITAPADPYYADQTISIECGGTNFATPTAASLVIKDTNNNEVVKSGCVYIPSDSSWSAVNTVTSDISGYFTPICGNLGDPSAMTSISAVIDGVVQKTLSGYSMLCEVAYGGVNFKRSESTTVSAVYVGPSNLTLTVTPDNGDNSKVGDTLSVKCSSDEATDPPSKYNYVVMKKSSVSESLSMDTENPATYTIAEVGVPEEIKFQCTDSVHTSPRWMGGNVVAESEEWIVPVYLVVNGETEISSDLNPNHKPTLTCDVQTKPDKEKDVIYSWTRDGETLSDMTRSIVVSNGTDKSTDVFKCTAQLTAFDLTATVSWTVTWNYEATTTSSPTTAASSTSPKTNGGMIAGIVIGGLAFIVIVIVAIYCIRKRKAESSRGAGQADKGKPDEEKGGNNGFDSHTPTNKDDDAIIYADLDLTGAKRPNVKKRDNGVEYAQIDINKTRAMSNKNNK